MDGRYQKIIEELSADRVLVDEPMSKHTHIKIGGPADLYFEASTREDLIKAVQLAVRLNIPLTVLGWASNTLVGDKGIRGLVIKNAYQEYEVLEELEVPEGEEKFEKADTRQVEWDEAKPYDFRDLDYVETGVPEVLVKVSSGYSLPAFIVKTLNEGITGLQWFAGIPGTIAGAVYNNIHGGKKLFGPYVKKATIVDGKTGEIREVEPDYFEFGYDKSAMHANQDVLVDVTLRLRRGDAEKAKWVHTEWARRKSVQPQNSLGCTFANPPMEVTEKMGYPTPSVGYFVEHVLGWKDKKKIGGAGMGRGYGHAAFIVNDDGATAKDYMDFVDLIKKEYEDRVGYELRPEVFFVGEF